MMDKIKDFFVKFKKETIFVSVVLLAAVISLIFVGAFAREGAYAEVTLDGEVVATYPLALDATYILNGGTNVLVIEDGECYMIEADCPDGTCKRRGRIHRVGESIVCLPNRISVVITGSGEDGPELVS